MLVHFLVSSTYNTSWTLMPKPFSTYHSTQVSRAEQYSPLPRITYCSSTCHTNFDINISFTTG